MVPPSNPTSFRTLSLRSVPHYVSPLSGHAILCSQGKWGRGAVPLTYVSLGSVSSLQDRIIASAELVAEQGITEDGVRSHLGDAGLFEAYAETFAAGIGKEQLPPVQKAISEW